MKVRGKVSPLADKVLVSDMEFGEEQTKSGIILGSDNGKAHGVRPRWGKVWAVGPEQKEFKVGQWLLIEHGRWTRTFEIEQEDGTILEVRGIEMKSVMLTSDEKPEDTVERKK